MARGADGFPPLRPPVISEERRVSLLKAFFLPLGAGAEACLPAVLTAMSCGAARQPASVSMLRVPASAPDPLADRLLSDLGFCRRLLAEGDAFAFFRTEWRSAVWLPRLPGRDELVRSEESRLLLRALRGDGVPFSLRTDREAAEWCFSALLDRVPGAGSSAGGADAEASADAVSESPAAGNASGGGADGLSPFLSYLEEIRSALDAGEDVRILLLCDLCEGYAAGLALALLRFLRARFADPAPFIGLVGQVRASGAAAEESVRAAKEMTAALSGRMLVRASDERETHGADAFWLLGLPASLAAGGEALRVLDWAAARVLGEAWTSVPPPAPGLHTRELPGVASLQSLDREAKSSAAFLRGLFWCLSDLFPSLRSWLEHPAPLRSLAPATRGGLFRRLIRSQDQGAELSAGLARLDRAFRALALQILTLLQSLPAPCREAEPVSDLWEKAIRVCGRFVTEASEYDVRRQEAADSGVDRVRPVHRVSLSDTEEEEMLRRLDQMAAGLSALQAEREEVFRQAGGWLSRAALEDCLSRCRAAETSAREKLVAMPADTQEDRYSLGLQERRVRLLKAAVLRCRRDLEAAAEWSALSRPCALRPASPLAGEILDPELAEQAFILLTAEGDTSENARVIRDGIGNLLRGYPLNDAKMLLKNLLSVCRQPESEAPLRSLLAGVFSVCGVEVSGLRLSSAGRIPAIPLLPDLTEGDRFFSIASAPSRLLAPGAEDRAAGKRGLLALVILRQYRRPEPGEGVLELLPLRGEDSSLVRVYLASRGVEQASLCCLRWEKDGGKERLPLAVLLPGLGPEPARLRPASLDAVPSFAFWLDRTEAVFRDPCPFLSEADRQILTAQLTRLRAGLDTPRSRALADFLSDWHRDIMQAPRRAEEPGSLRRRLRIVCGLSRLPVWQKDLQRVSAFFEPSLPEDPVCAALLGLPTLEAASPKTREDVLYAFRGTPVARENALLLLESTHAPEEARLLSSLDTECDILLHSSDDYHEALAEGLTRLLDRFPGADPDARKEAESLLEEARAPITERTTSLTWPWDTFSSSVLTILTECLGAELAPAALHAFSDRLALFPARGGEILGDVLLSGLCQVRHELPEAAEPAEPAGAAGTPENAPAPEAEVRADAVLPPLSPDFARLLCRTPQGQSLVQPGFLSFRAEEASVRAELTLEGAFTLKLVRVYAPEEILAFYAHDLPTLALWPSLPFAAEDWHAYFSFVHAADDFRFTAVDPEGEEVLSGSAPRFAACRPRYPVCYLVSFRGEAVGAVPNLLPAPELPSGGDWTACLDFGASAASAVFTDGTSRWPLGGGVSVRTLLRSPSASEDLLWREFLPAVPVTPLLPAALRLFRADPAREDLPLRDGVVFMSSSLRDVLEISPEALYTDLKWNGEKGRAAGLYLHQVMLMTALQARFGGARSLCWRAALPDEMAAEGRERLAATLRSLADSVSRESGLPAPEKRPPVSFAPESAALGAYFRFCSPDQTRGGFMTLDLGADTADLSLFLRGREEAVRSIQLPLGLHNMLLPALLSRPEMLGEDFGFLEDPGFLRDLEDLQSLLNRARRDPAALRQARCGLDALLADHLPLLTEALARRRAAGSPGRTGALVLLHECYLMMLSGLLLLQLAGDPLTNDGLPDAMTLFLAGRGSLLMECLSPQAKTSLWKMLTMFRNSRVRSLNLIFSSEKKLEIPVGLSVLSGLTESLPRPAPSSAAVAVRPEELLPEFLLRFRREFPEEAGMLFPGLYAADPFAPLTPFGLQLIAQALQASFDARDPGRPFPALAACLGHLLDMIQEGGMPS